MKKLLGTVLAASLALSSTSAFAGGVVVIDDVVETKPTSSVGILPILIGVVVLCAIACGGDDNQE